MTLYKYASCNLSNSQPLGNNCRIQVKKEVYFFNFQIMVPYDGTLRLLSNVEINSVKKDFSKIMVKNYCSRCGSRDDILLC